MVKLRGGGWVYPEERFMSWDGGPYPERWYA